ncbi:prephenate dehydrogenase [uncultured Parolsenella sp.]|uniref:prephenate dehydrogenase n=1 Tax=uncultured Parolsenella sp. TaxID=2083008 RepID=UPI0027DBCF46|nr:prephenate dehydrogenase [uncultured Parolsenella sp.]
MAQENTQAQPSQMVAGRVGVVGLGLIGGSIARAMARGGHEVYAFDLNTDIETFAAIETTAGTLTDELVPTCELIVLACYPKACVDWLREHADLVSPDAIVIDTGGVKRSICEPCFEIAREAGITFVGCHPMAGTQFSGYAHSRANMFEGAPMVVCPAPEVRGVECLALVDRLEGLLSPCGFDKFTVTTPERHDEVIAYTSQLAHVVSNAYVKSPTLALRQGFAAGSYRDLTRVARLNPTMWCELFLDDADNLSREISTLIDALEQYKDALEDRDAERLTELLAEGDRIKRADEGEAEV